MQRAVLPNVPQTSIDQSARSSSSPSRTPFTPTGSLPTPRFRRLWHEQRFATSSILCGGLHINVHFRPHSVHFHKLHDQRGRFLQVTQPLTGRGLHANGHDYHPTPLAPSTHLTLSMTRSNTIPHMGCSPSSNPTPTRLHFQPVLLQGLQATSQNPGDPIASALSTVWSPASHGGKMRAYR